MSGRSEQHERSRIARVLHDDLQQRLYSLQMKVGMLRSQHDDDDELGAHLTEIEQRLRESIDLTRTLTSELSPPALEREDVGDAIGWLATQMSEMHALGVDVRARGSFPVPREDLRVTLVEIVRELLFNVVKHAGVDRATVALGRRDGRLRITVTDHGRGFVPETAVRSHGLSNAIDRLAPFGGRLDIVSAPDRGTSAEVTVPEPDRSA